MSRYTGALRRSHVIICDIMTSRRIPSDSDFDDLIDREILWTTEDVTWRERNENKDHWTAMLPLEGSDIGFDFTILIQANKWIRNDFGISLVCARSIQVRRLDFGHNHRNPPNFRPPTRVIGPHLHQWTDHHEDHHAIPANVDEIDDCENAFYWFLRETKITFTGRWQSFPETTPRFQGM